MALPQYLAEAIALLKSKCEASHEADLQAVFLEITSRLMGKMAYNVSSPIHWEGNNNPGRAKGKRNIKI